MRTLLCSLIAVLPAVALGQQPPEEREKPQPQRVQQDEKPQKDTMTKDPLAPAGARAICCRADKVIGSNVMDATGKQIGTIKDLAIDPGDGRIAYGVLSFGGFLGLGDKYFAIPWASLKAEADGTYRFDVTEEKLKEADGFDKNNWPDMASAHWARTTQERFGQRAGEPGAGHAAAERKGAAAGTTGAQRIVQGTQLIGAAAKDGKQESLGTLKDLLLDRENGRVNCVVLSTGGGLLGAGSKLVAVPFMRVTIQPQEDDSTEPREVKSVVVNVEREQLESAPNFTDRDWPQEDDRDFIAAVYEFYNVPMPH